MTRRAVAGIVALGIGLVACGGSSDGDDLEAYIEQLKPIGEREQELLDRYQAVVGENYESDEELYGVVSEIVEPYTRITEDYEAIKPEDDEVAEAHDILLASTNATQRGLVRVKGALEEGDASLAADANVELEDGRQLARDYGEAIEELAG